MKEYFIFASSFAAPFVSDTSTHFHKGESAGHALNDFAANGYKHPAGLYAAAAYDSADAYHRHGPILARWLSNHARVIEETRPTSVRSDGPGMLELDGKAVTVEKPKEGSLVA